MTYIPIEDVEVVFTSSYPDKQKYFSKHIQISSTEIELSRGYSRDVIITNLGYEDITLKGIYLVGAYVLLTPLPTTLLKGKSHTLTISSSSDTWDDNPGMVVLDAPDALGDKHILINKV